MNHVSLIVPLDNKYWIIPISNNVHPDYIEKIITHNTYFQITQKPKLTIYSIAPDGAITFARDRIGNQAYDTVERAQEVCPSRFSFSYNLETRTWTKNEKAVNKGASRNVWATVNKIRE